MDSFSVSQAELNNVLGVGSRMLIDNSIKDDKKAMIFTVGSEDDSSLSVYNPYGFIRQRLALKESNLSKPWQFRINPKELSKIASGYRPNPITYVSGFEFQNRENRALVRVHEEPIEEGFNRYAETSNYSVNYTAAPKQILESVALEFPAEYEEFSAASLNVVLSLLQPLLANDSTGADASSIFISREYVFTTSNNMFSFIQNPLPDCFDGITLNYSAVATLRKLTDLALATVQGTDFDVEFSEDDVQDEESHPEDDALLAVKFQAGKVLEGDRLLYLAIRYGETEVFIRPRNMSMPSHKEKSSMIFATDDEGEFVNRNTGIVVNRAYFKSVLNRLSYDGGEILFTFGDGTLKVSSSHYDQDVPLENYKGDIDGLKFMIALNLLSRMILGDSKSESVFFYMIPNGRRCNLFASDESGIWSTSVTVQTR